MNYNRKVIRILERIDKFIEDKGKAMGLENRTEVAKRAINEFLKKNEN